MQYNFELKMDTLYLLNKKYSSYDIKFFLNSAQDEFIRDTLYGVRNQPPILPGNKKLEADLFPILYTFNTTGGTGINVGMWSNHFYYQLKNLLTVQTQWPYQYFVDLMVELRRTNPTISSEQFISCDVITQQEADKFAHIPGVNKPHFIKPVCWFTNYGVAGQQHINFMIDAYSTKYDLSLTYTMPPKPINENIAEFNNTYNPAYMSLPPHTHQAIVDIAVRQAIQALKNLQQQPIVAEQEQIQPT